MNNLLSIFWKDVETMQKKKKNERPKNGAENVYEPPNTGAS